MEFINNLKDSAFSKLDVYGYAPDLSGWMDPHFEVVIREKLAERDRSEPLLVIEVGSWKGLSTVTLASVLKSMGFTQFNIICIDTWLGAPEFWTWGLNDPTRGGSLNRIDGYPSVFRTFTKNVKTMGHSDVIAPFPISSQQALEVVKYYKLEADLIYVDASHEYEAVKDDIEWWWTVLKPGGILMGDDYRSNWPGVVRAVNEKGTPELRGVVWTFKK
jgi:predicted O-methyltransferase YrrM